MEIELQNVVKWYGKQVALRGVDLRIGPGMFGLLGPNGAGKTTLLRTLVGLIRPNSGRALADGVDASREPGKSRLRRTLGYLPQEFGVYPDLTAREFLDYMALLKEIVDPRQRRGRVQQVLEWTGLQNDADRKLRGFSGGMRRRVGIAQALLNDPELLVVDEPTAGLDPEERIRFRNLLAGLAGERTVILSTHIVEDIGQSCREMAVLSTGVVAWRGEPEALRQMASGRVLEVEWPTGQPLPEGWSAVSTVNLGARTRYRLLRLDPAAEVPQGARPAEPGLEEAYLLLMDSLGRQAKSGAIRQNA